MVVFHLYQLNYLNIDQDLNNTQIHYLLDLDKLMNPPLRCLQILVLHQD